MSKKKKKINTILIPESFKPIWFPYKVWNFLHTYINSVCYLVLENGFQRRLISPLHHEFFCKKHMKRNSKKSANVDCNVFFYIRQFSTL